MGLEFQIPQGQGLRSCAFVSMLVLRSGRSFSFMYGTDGL